MPQQFSIRSIQGTERVRSAIATASARTGMSFDYLFNQARIESALKPDAKAKTSSAQGLFQFTRQTWFATIKSHGPAHGLGWAADAVSQDAAGRYHVADPGLRASILDLRNDPEAASSMAAEFAADNEEYLGNRLGRTMEPVDLYLAHFLGAGGATKFLSAHANQPDHAAAPLFPQAAAANRAIFYAANGRMRTLDEIRGSFAKKLGADAPEMPPPSSNWAFAGHAPTPLPPAMRPRHSDDAPRPFQLLGIEPMPERLSIDFARRAYQRLAAMGGGRDA